MLPRWREKFFTIRSKLMLGFGVILFLNLLMGFALLYMFGQVNASYNRLISREVKVMNETQAALVKFEQAALDLRGYMLSGDPNYIMRYQEEMETAQKAIDQLGKSITFPEGKNYFNTLLKAVADFKVYGDGAIVLKRQSLLEADQLAGYRQIEDYLNQGKGTVERVVQAGNAIVLYMEDQLNKGKQHNNEISLQVKRWVIGGMAASVLLGLVIAVLIVNMISTPVRDLTRQAGRIAEGDLTTDKVWVKSKDELQILAKAFNKMTGNLSNILSELREKSSQVASRAQQLTAIIQQTSSGITGSTAVMHQMAATVSQVADNTQNVSRMAESAGGQAREGQTALDNIRLQMEQIIFATRQVGQAINNLNQTSRAVFQIVDLITEIAEQTNLLALNAAIEAARAGQEGMGFAVVAEEVRKLAERSAKAAGEIRVLITAVQEESGKAVSAMDKGVREVETGNRVLAQVGVVLESIIQSVQDVETQIREVAAAS
ncbi:methyl-accepting chemotaxis protein [Desulforamulus hydrothermalis]|uniref:Chemotaxis sensory transducer n=1 Tax=Desulforamulus hydrothermalis Lam5 = DSM 18033 TaxID=1121428 RepID=K8E0G6_9FIRM|nr:methyl-accepting chemotaxis protein [Desulforamulus hydrothermalis]CCO09047.1 Chemotaxis sensory transducer [Desulforamulus hydrothermalis Lam5 = DSM 18033]SHG77817.1 methyl-accepting chemotaxis protein [Desulforamulus hydrothermalis Lam5 = DSM 18033]